MSKTFRIWDVDQAWLLPPSLHQFVPPGHLAHFVRDTVREALDLSAIIGVYKSEQGQPGYHPGMLVALLLYGYSRGIYSSRQLARACEERVDMMAVTGLNRPDFRTVSDFRKRHLAALQQLFVQVLRLCQAAGLVKLGHVAVDGTKLKANASKHKAMRYKHMVHQEPKLAAEVASWLEQADAAEVDTDCASRSSSRCSDTSSRPEASDSSSSVASPRSEASGRWSAPSTTASSCTKQQPENNAIKHPHPRNTQPWSC